MNCPTRCYSCGKILGNKVESFEKYRRAEIQAQKTMSPDLSKVFDKLGLTRLCCRIRITTSIQFYLDILESPVCSTPFY